MLLFLMSVIFIVLLSFCLIVSRHALYHHVCLPNVNIRVLSVCVCNKQYTFGIILFVCLMIIR